MGPRPNGRGREERGRREGQALQVLPGLRPISPSLPFPWPRALGALFRPFNFSNALAKSKRGSTLTSLGRRLARIRGRRRCGWRRLRSRLSPKSTRRKGRYSYCGRRLAGAGLKAIGNVAALLRW